MTVFCAPEGLKNFEDTNSIIPFGTLYSYVKKEGIE